MKRASVVALLLFAIWAVWVPLFNLQRTPVNVFDEIANAFSMDNLGEWSYEEEAQ